MFSALHHTTLFSAMTPFFTSFRFLGEPEHLTLNPTTKPLHKLGWPPCPEWGDLQGPWKCLFRTVRWSHSLLYCPQPTKHPLSWLTDAEGWDAATTVFIVGQGMGRWGPGGPEGLPSQPHTPTGEGSPEAHGCPEDWSISALLGPGTWRQTHPHTGLRRSAVCPAGAQCGCICSVETGWATWQDRLEAG